NVAPVVSVPASFAATAGSPLTVNATFSDPGVNDAPWAYAINWGDGSAQTTGSTTSQAGGVSASHTYAAAGTNTATVTVTDQAGDPTKGYYSFDLGAWHIVVLNSNGTFVPTAVGSPQETWLKADLAATTKRCVAALFHHPRFYSTTSTSFFPTTSVKPFWDDL